MSEGDRTVTTATAPETADVDVPVLIVGGGGAGLTCSMLLARLGIESLLVSSLPTTSILPKAHVLNQRTMEILGDLGVAEAIHEKSTPAENMSAMLDWRIGRGGVLTNESGGQAVLRITPPVHRLSWRRRVARADFARALIAAADAPAASRQLFDVFNEAGEPATSAALTAQFDRLGATNRIPDDRRPRMAAMNRSGLDARS